MPMTDKGFVTRFWEKVDKTSSAPCWNWTGRKNFGYGCFWDGERNWRAHRFSFVQLRGPIPEGKVLDHLCRNRKCVNPDHLEAVTSTENVLRGIGPTANNKRKVKCNLGHDYKGRATLSTDGWRVCQECVRIRTAKWRERQAVKSAGRSRDFRAILVRLACGTEAVISTSMYRLTPARKSCIVGDYVRSGVPCPNHPGLDSISEVLGTMGLAEAHRLLSKNREGEGG